MRAPSTGGLGAAGGGLSPQVEIAGCPPSQSHCSDCSSMSSSALGGKKEKLITKVVWGSRSRAERERAVETASQKVAFTLLSSSTTFSVSFPSSLALTL